jgi:hypothetical protein
MLSATEPHPRPSYPASSQIVVITDKRTRDLAAAMLRLNAEAQDTGGCTDALLLAEGFSLHELETLAPAARQLANQGFVRQVADDPIPRKTDDELLAIALDRCGGLVDVGQIVAKLRGELSFTHDSLARIWPRLAVKLAKRVATTPIPDAAAWARAS